MTIIDRLAPPADQAAHAGALERARILARLLDADHPEKTIEITTTGGENVAVTVLYPSGHDRVVVAVETVPTYFASAYDDVPFAEPRHPFEAADAADVVVWARRRLSPVHPADGM